MPILVPQRANMGALDLLYLGVTIENMCRRHYRAPWPPPVSKELLTGGPPVSKELLTGGPPVSNELLTGGPLVSKELLTGGIRSITSSFLIFKPVLSSPAPFKIRRGTNKFIRLFFGV